MEDKRESEYIDVHEDRNSCYTATKNVELHAAEEDYVEVLIDGKPPSQHADEESYGYVGFDENTVTRSPGDKEAVKHPNTLPDNTNTNSEEIYMNTLDGVEIYSNTGSYHNGERAPESNFQSELVYSMAGPIDETVVEVENQLYNK